MSVRILKVLLRLMLGSSLVVVNDSRKSLLLNLGWWWRWAVSGRIAVLRIKLK